MISIRSIQDLSLQDLEDALQSLEQAEFYAETEVDAIADEANAELMIQDIQAELSRRKRVIKIRCNKNAEGQVYVMFPDMARFNEIKNTQLENVEKNHPGAMSWAQAFLRKAVVDLDKLSPVARFLAEHISWAWEGNQISPENVYMYPHHSTAWHMRHEFQEGILPKYVATSADHLEKKIRAYGLDEKHEAVNFRYSFEFFDSGTAEEYFERHALKLLAYFPGRIMISSLQDGKIAEYTLSEAELKTAEELYNKKVADMKTWPEYWLNGGA